VSESQGTHRDISAAEAAGKGASRYLPGAFTRSAPHVRDHNNLARITTLIIVSLIPAVLLGLHNTGMQTVTAMADAGVDTLPGWRSALLTTLAPSTDSISTVGAFVLGLSYFLPVYVVAGVTASAWQALFAALRKTEVSEGLGVIVLLFTLSMPPTIALWKVAVGISFGVVIGREIFGGTGRHFLNPALVGLAFLYFAYPSALRDGAVWVPIDGWSGATPLAAAAASGAGALAGLDVSWPQAFVGSRPGAFGETSVLACTIGAVFLLSRGLISWRILAGGVTGLAVSSVVFERLASGVLPLADLPWYWHATLGSFAFGLVFFATDAVTAPATNRGKWLYGILIGFLTVLIRVANPSHTEGVMLAILFGNAAAPMIDYFVIVAYRRKRRRAHA
jgi:Na+-transporting NADH:ubiquinone oxidoreductase subunit B